GVRAGRAADVAAEAGGADPRRGGDRRDDRRMDPLPSARARRLLVAGHASAAVVAIDDRALLARDVGPRARRGATAGTVAGGVGTAVRRAALRQSRPAGFP